MRVVGTRRRLLVSRIALICVAVGLGSSSATRQVQTPAAPASADKDVTFRAAAQEVLVDAAVVDKQGNFQRNLTRQDFKILEDGKEQKITSFSLESAGA